MPYVYANVKLKYGQLPAFFETMVTIKRVMEEHGWKLVGAWSTVIGDLHEVHDLWESRTRTWCRLDLPPPSLDSSVTVVGRGSR